MEGRYDFQEARQEELPQKISLECSYVFSWSCTDEGSSLRVPEGRSLAVVEKPSRPKLK